MAEVWRAHDTELERTVAIKLLGPDADSRRFEREARSAAALSHPNLVQLFDFGHHGGRPFMVLEYLPGGTLEERLAEGNLSDAETGRIAAEIAAGLAYAHAHDLVHRDLKPANVFFDAEGRAKVGDFGIARLGDAGTLTEAGTVLGTAAYISPEQAAGEPATPASDVYSFGVILYRALTGRLPFEAESALAVAAMHQTAEIPPIADVRADAPPVLESLAVAALRKDPGDRPPHGAALAAELAPFAPTAAAAAGEDATLIVPRATPAERRPPVAAIGVVVAALALAGVGLAALLTNDEAAGDELAPPPSEATTTRTTRTATTAEPRTRERPTTTRTRTRARPPATLPPVTSLPETFEEPPTTTVELTTTEPPTTTG